MLHLITLDFTRNWKQPREWLTVLLFLLSISVVLFMGFNRMRAETWAVMYWIVMLFMAVGAIVGDQGAGSSREKYLYNLLATPVEIFISRIVFNTLLLLVLALILYLVFGIFFDWQLVMNGQVLLIVVLGTFSLSVIFCFVSTLVLAAEKGSILASLLGFPLVIPVILLLIRLFLIEMGFTNESQGQIQDYLSLIGIDALLIGLGIILFPLIWRS
ncbi:MAG: heme exporter protein CcmB [Saprospiraceae bacterium]|nr:heme exporter protein CcmB [Saprospiraceae bacterium]